MVEKTEVAAKKGGIGCGAFIILGIFLIMIAGIGADQAIRYYYQECGFKGITLECFQQISDEEDRLEGAVTATGTYKFSKYYANVSMDIVLKGGEIAGSFEGTCDGKMQGTYDGDNHGKIEGKFSGTCDPFLINVPATGEFHGTVNKDTKTVAFYFSGSSAGFDHSGSMSLSY